METTNLICNQADYFMSGFLIPVGVLTVGTTYFTLEVVRILRKREWKDRIAYCAIAFIMLAYFCYRFYPTLRFTWVYPLDKETVTISGVVENVVPCSPYTRYYAKGSDEIRRPMVVTLNGEEYFSMNTEAYVIGNSVELTYLTKSRIVLECKEILNAETK